MLAVKKTNRIWIAVDRNAKKFIDFVIGDRSTKTGKKLADKLKNVSAKTWFMADYWQPYQGFLLSHKHIQSKAETFTVEGYNSLFRHFLARLRKKSKCYSKSIEMLSFSIELLISKHNRTMQSILG